MTVVPYDFTLPVAKIPLQWRPIAWGDELDIRAAHKAPNLAHLVDTALLARRIIKFGEKPGCEVHDLRSLDPLDIEALTDHIAEKEAERRAALLGKQDGQNPRDRLQTAVDQLQICAMQFNSALGVVITCAKAMMQDGDGPLASSPSS